MGVRVVVMGVAGSGKSTVGPRVAATLRAPFADADAFHPPPAVAKMAAGDPLTDDDRWPWLEAIASWLGQHDDGAVVACSALKRAYRDVLRSAAPDAWFLHLAGTQTLMTERVSGRAGHFMPAALVESQFRTLEPPGEDERAVTIDAGQPPDRIVAAFADAIGADRPG